MSQSQSDRLSRPRGSHPFEHPFTLVEEGQEIKYETAGEAASDAEFLRAASEAIGNRVIKRRVYVDFELVKRVLLPFAEMHRPGCKEDELACQRGVASDMTIITALDFQQAARLLGPEFEKELKEKYELVIPTEEPPGIGTFSDEALTALAKLDEEKQS